MLFKLRDCNANCNIDSLLNADVIYLLSLFFFLSFLMIQSYPLFVDFTIYNLSMVIEAYIVRV